MPRPITKKDVARWRRDRDYHWKLRVITNELGVCIKCWSGSWSYSADKHGDPIWLSKKALMRRVKLGWPAPRKKRRVMKDISVFSMEEIEASAELIAELQKG